MAGRFDPGRRHGHFDDGSENLCGYRGDGDGHLDHGFGLGTDFGEVGRFRFGKRKCWLVFVRRNPGGHIDFVCEFRQVEWLACTHARHGGEQRGHGQTHDFARLERIHPVLEHTA